MPRVLEKVLYVTTSFNRKSSSSLGSNQNKMPSREHCGLNSEKILYSKKLLTVNNQTSKIESNLSHCYTRSQ